LSALVDYTTLLRDFYVPYIKLGGAFEN
jgi:hypothetical protein